ncbi:hypothetical protein ABBQ38_008138 [Trebouxia sp. C0009 RCD-2024]
MGASLDLCKEETADFKKRREFCRIWVVGLWTVDLAADLPDDIKLTHYFQGR